MSTTETKPTILFVPGAWHSPEGFNVVRSQLKTLGYPTDAVTHASIGEEPPVKSLADDAAILRAAIQKLADEGKQIVVVVHSYGGVVGSCAVEGLGWSQRKSVGKTGGIIQYVKFHLKGMHLDSTDLCPYDSTVFILFVLLNLRQNPIIHKADTLLIFNINLMLQTAPDIRQNTQKRRGCSGEINSQYKFSKWNQVFEIPDNSLPYVLTCQPKTSIFECLRSPKRRLSAGCAARPIFAMDEGYCMSLFRHSI